MLLRRKMQILITAAVCLGVDPDNAELGAPKV